jgi:hypothetical protein
MQNFTYSIKKEELILNCVKFDAKSGPWGNGPLPVGFYSVGDLIPIASKIGFCVDGLGYWIKIKPLFKTKRFGLGIHPDGNVPGTLGCIGLQGYHSRLFHDIWPLLT